EGRDEPSQRPLVAGVVDPVLRQAGEPLAVVEPELLAEPARHTRVTPGLERDRVDVDETPGRDNAGNAEDQPADSLSVAMRKRDPAPEEVRGDRRQIVTE